MSWEKRVYRRQQIYDEIWKEPVRTVAKRYGVSDVALSKMCRKLGVPRPPLGFWARRAAGYDDPVPPLGNLPKGAREVIEVSLWHDHAADVVKGERVRALVVRERTGAMRVEVAERLESPHPLIVKSRPILERAGCNIEPTLREKVCLDVGVSAGSLDRALRIMDALLKTFESRGHTIELNEPVAPDGFPFAWGVWKGKHCETGVRIGKDLVLFSLSEGCDQVEVAPPPTPKRRRSAYEPSAEPKYEERPTGVLTLSINSRVPAHSRRRWTDSRKRTIESSLNDFLAGVTVAAEYVRSEREEYERRRREQEERVRREEARRLAAARRQRRATRLHGEVERWRLSRDIRAYVSAARSTASGLGSKLDTARLERRLAWAEAYADQIDPMLRLKARLAERRGRTA